jgi:predicted protein tyrosine phosphatase
MIHVCSLARLHETVASSGALHIVTLLKHTDRVERPFHIPASNHLVLNMDDIAEPIDGYVPPNEQHIVQLVEFVRAWDRKAPLVMHCFAGISRSTAGAFVAACAVNPGRSEAAIASAIHAASPTAMPNVMIVKHGDAVLGRKGRMVAAIKALSEANPAIEAEPFKLTLD